MLSHQPLFTDAYLWGQFANEFEAFKGSAEEERVYALVEKWASRVVQKETTAQAAFLNVFFEDMWGYIPTGKAKGNSDYTLYPQYPVAGAGQGGGQGEADLALGHFNHPTIPATPQVLCEFKDIRSNLDAPQKRKGNTRSPVKQCADYLREAAKNLFGNELVQPTWGVVTDMNEFRLYWRNTIPTQYQRFVIKTKTGDDVASLLGSDDEASFQRFLFAKLLSKDWLLTDGGQSLLLQLLRRQWVQEKEIESGFYKEYQSYRTRLINLIIRDNPDFPGTKGRIVRLAQKLIDRCIFVLFCEDMGEELAFPPNAMRDYLAALSKMPGFDPSALDAWNKLKELFQAMNEGKKFGQRVLNRFNGGLFAPDTDLEGLRIPNEAFCALSQGENEETLVRNPDTLLYMSAAYNFGTSRPAGRAISLYTLGRIFEQSITELEALEAEAENRPSLTEVGKRKRDGVYYTPEWVVEQVVRETLEPRLEEIRSELGWSVRIEGDDELVREQKQRAPSDRTKEFKKHCEAVTEYRKHLEGITILDPACGSGAFLIHVLEYLLRERQRVSNELARVTVQGESLFEFRPQDEIRSILSKNLFGVDINPASVEIAQLALWLHTAKGDQPLSNLENNICCGNSLVGPEFYQWDKDLLTLPDEKKEIVNAFDWAAQFPLVFEEGKPNGPGFDCIVGNPPYVKLQNFRKVHAEVAEFLREGREKDGRPIYLSTQSGNFDLFLPFIEKSLELLHERGRLGFIAPSLWRLNEYGEGLRKLLHEGGHLDRWMDFGSYQVFEEATTYTALQYYTKARQKAVRFVMARDGEPAKAADWDDANWSVPYKDLPLKGSWIFVPRAERMLMARLSGGSVRLDDPSVTQNIFQGLITSADHIYHLERLGPGRYQYQPKKKSKDAPKPPAVEVSIEDAIMHPLVSGPEAKRYEIPVTTTYVLFPYLLKDGQARLMTPAEMSNYPQAWKFLKSNEAELRAREGGKFDNEQWYQFGRNQGLDKQTTKKLLVAQTVPSLRVCPDEKGEFYVNNVRVNGIIPANEDDFWYLLGVLNSRVADWVFRRIAKPKDGGYFEANKQFIAPLPVPKANKKQKTEVAAVAEKLTQEHTRARKLQVEIERRLDTCTQVKKPIGWLWPELEKVETSAPSGLSGQRKTAWVKQAKGEVMACRVEQLRRLMRDGARFEPAFVNGELMVDVGGGRAVEKVYVDDLVGRVVLLDWKLLQRRFPISAATDVEDVVKALCSVHETSNAATVSQMEKLEEQLSAIEASCIKNEAALDALVFKLFGLTESDVAMVLAG